MEEAAQVDRLTLKAETRHYGSSKCL